MIDRLKRKTLKLLGSISLVGAAPALLAKSAPHTGSDSVVGTDSSPVNPFDKGLDAFTVGVTHNPVSNNIELAISNTGDHDTTITAMTPRTIETARGVFDLNALVKKDGLRMVSGETVTVPLAHSRQSQAVPGSVGSGTSVVKSLKEKFSIVTDNNAFAAVTVKTLAPFA